jgi:hypothetical protein
MLRVLASHQYAAAQALLRFGLRGGLDGASPQGSDPSLFGRFFRKLRISRHGDAW